MHLIQRLLLLAICWITIVSCLPGVALADDAAENSDSQIAPIAAKLAGLRVLILDSVVKLRAGEAIV